MFRTANRMVDDLRVAAWAVTTDVLRISPRPHDNPYNRYGPQGKTRIDNLQPRNDQEFDIFQLNSIASKTSTTPPVIMKVVTQKTLSRPTNSPSAVDKKAPETPKASDILSRLISDMPIPKHPKNFVVFAPVADASAAMDKLNGRRFDGKIIVHDSDDLMAEESVFSEEISQEALEQSAAFTRKRKSSRESSSHDMKSEDTKLNLRVKNGKSPHAIREISAAENQPPPLKRNHQNERVTASSKFTNSITNRNGGNTQPIPNTNQQHINGYLKDAMIQQNFRLHESLNADSQKIYQNTRPSPEQNKIPNHIQQLPSPPNAAYQNPMGISNQNQINGRKNFPNVIHSNIQQLQPPHDHLRKATFQNKAHPGPVTNRQFFHKPPPTLGQPSFSSPNLPSPNNPNQNHHPSVPSQNHPQFQPHEYRSVSPLGQPQTYQPSPPNVPPNLPVNSNQGSSSNSFINNNLQPPINSFPMDLSNSGPQYFAPPPQTFHTKTSYDRPAGKLSPGASLSSFEKVAQSAVEQSKDGLHHHHHHHHHHEPAPANSDLISDVNLSDVPRTNDADRLGTISIGQGSPRGITVQIGGGGGGLGGLLPLGALGIAKNIVASLLPRPTLGLNSKVFLGVEVGKGGGLSLLG
ncbi:uncharacterized protein TNIN_383951 [Trichonephila inaurata madagascariensis]|uniref:Uncharacterized protein n=1 Tax=Trichonephila inaurata madagascariensis TaxID=2747483 RepID=A0A8X6IQA0_9ARAC|nr:uncharacterized protein TNIN_383951 [Trichonephila inaurata madagascariensis]